MLLTKIKLSGFKSFVNPTTLIVSNSLVGIVGPNGCGKSNIIDAVTWVMGESSAKHLRGDSLTDVIFNGSSSRQPVGQASVELLFDNSEGRLGGQYASYNEISIKRQISREGISTYYLNNSRCRRRDIQSIFLGTGLGPRSYAIIEQGVISRLIEAKPDELRTFIEEAAGISKYRERRRETENRMRHTRENIDRLNDIREELNKQLNHLQRQAKAAERYQKLKQEERQLNTELLALKWQEFSLQTQTKDEKVQQKSTLLEQELAKLRSIEADIEKQREELSSDNEALNQAQSDFYQTSGDISQLEQKIQHVKERVQSLTEELEQAGESTKSLNTQRDEDNTRLLALSKQADSLSPQLQGARKDSNKAYDTLNHAEMAMQGWQSEWDACNAAMADFNRQIEVDLTRLEHVETDMEDNDARKHMFTEELNNIELDSIKEQLSGLTQQIEQNERTIQIKKSEIENKQKQVRDLRKNIHKSNEDLTAKRTEYYKLEGEITSLEALQQANDTQSVNEWLKSIKLHDAPRLVQQLKIEPRWVLAFETVLGQRLQDVCITDTGKVAKSAARLKQGNVGFVSVKKTRVHDNNTKIERLVDKAASTLSLDNLKDIYVASDIADALGILDKLKENESVVTEDGIWLSKDWIRLNKQTKQQTGIISREQKIQTSKKQADKYLQEINTLESLLEDANSKVEHAEQGMQGSQNDLTSEQEKLSALQSQFAENKILLEQAEKRITWLQKQLDEIEDLELENKQEYESVQQRIKVTEADKKKLEIQQTNLNKLRDHHHNALNGAREQWQSTHEQSHEIALQLESISSQRASLQQAIQRAEIQISNLHNREQELSATLTTTQAPVTEFEQSLEAKLTERVQAEKVLSEARNRVQMIDTKLRDKEQERMTCEKLVQEAREQLEAVKISAQEAKVRMQTIQEQLGFDKSQIHNILDDIGIEADQETWQERLNDVERKIHRLGPINLAAIDEFEQLSERKVYMDKQYDDLNAALTTLEGAIKKIDRETRTRFKETFDQLNIYLKELFPGLFGGGHAYLEMTGEDLLETGVTIMAQPPGKRNSTIHLLSGGEKALTAVALVFSIFKLNPAPFCILDEVDAPLDDANVARFSELVMKMSEDIQFIFVTHNKITMEIAHQLLGVTMHEAGVSRLVSVDVDEAVEMAATA